MNVLITGATGKLGQKLIAQLKGSALAQLGEKEAEIFALVRNKTNNIPINQIQSDILNSDSLNSALKDKKIGLVIHLAGLTHTYNLKDYFKVNLEGTQNIIQACQENSIQRLIFVSTRAIGKNAGAYGYSKYLAEEEIKKSNLAWIIIRPSEIYGLGSQEGIDKLMQTCQKGPLVPIPGHGQYLLNPVYYQDVVNFLIQVITQPKQFKMIYTLAGPKDYTYKKLAQEISSQFNKKNILIPIPLFLLKIFSQLKLFIYPDQVARLRVAKSSDISQAVQDYNFQPLDIFDYFKVFNKVDN